MVGLTTNPQHYRTAALNYWRDEAVRSWILVNPASIGDTWGVFALAEAFKARHGGPLTMVVKQSHAAIAEMFPGVADRVIAWDDQRLIGFCSRLYGLSSFDKDEPILAHPYFFTNDFTILRLLELFQYPGRGGVTLADQFRLMLRLDWTAPLAKPVIPAIWREEAAAYAAEVGIEPGRSVVLLPDNNSVAPLPDSFWQALAGELGRLGYKVFTNMVGNNAGPRTAPLDGTSPVHLTVRLAIPLMELVGRFISMSNGMSALLIACGVKAQHELLILLPPEGDAVSFTGLAPANAFTSQSMRFAALGEGPFREFAVRPGDDNAELIKAIARGDLSRAIQWPAQNPAPNAAG